MGRLAVDLMVTGQSDNPAAPSLLQAVPVRLMTIHEQRVHCSLLSENKKILMKKRIYMID